MTTTTARRPARGVSPRLAPLAAAAALLASFPAQADLTVTPTLTVSEIWTDNVNLAADAFAYSDLITQISPGLSVSQRSRRFTIDASAQLHKFAYMRDQPGRDASGADPLGVGNGTNDTQRTYNGSLKGELAQDLLYLDATASRGQQGISAFGPQPGNDLYSRNNRTDIKTWSVSPYLMHRIGSTATALVRYTRDSVDGGEHLGFGSTEGDSLLASLTSGTAFRTVGWTLSYTRQKLSGDDYGDSLNESVSANLRYFLNRRLTLTADAGYDRYEYEGLGGGEQGANWALGFIWTPSLRTNVQASLGRHFYGTTGSLMAMHRTRHTTANVSYGDTITTTRQQFLLPSTVDTAGLLDRLFATAYPDPEERRRVVAAYIQSSGLPPALADSVNYLSNRFIRQKLLRASFAYRKARSSAVLSAHASDRDAVSDQMSDSPLLGSQQGFFNDQVRQFGLQASYSYQISSRTRLTAGFDIDRSRSLEADRESFQRTLRIGASRQFGDLLAAADVRRRTGDLYYEGSGKFTEHALVASLSMKF